MEAQDAKILKALQRDGRLTNQQLAHDVGMSISACWRRVRALEEAGIITRYAALVDREKAGLHLSAILYISLERHDAKNVKAFVNSVTRRPEILECLATTGDADYHLRVVARDIQSYNAFLDEFLLRLPGIRQVRSNIVLKEIKMDVALPV
ncbi:MAG TPA: Lrp/AsnC family transcriptional regulator [Hellea balneolensis]|uniref:Lrp/AsnC family transcriptional regulator n=1 Tax=Hellea balneolensis TaxID=287478 RepID=A0A7C5M015_9PROT|nr:Lrp/AsnC family transcriptional regulator [Hellea balneolensis]